MERKRISSVLWYLCLSSLLFYIYILFNIESRTALISFSVAAGFLLFPYAKAAIKQNKVYRILFILLLTSILGYLIFLFVLKHDSLLGRALIWKVCFSNIGDYIWLGNGFNSFDYFYNLYQVDYFKSSSVNVLKEGRLGSYINYAYNDLLQVGIEYGLPGISIALFFTVALFRRPKSHLNTNENEQNNYIKIAKALILSFLVSSLFYYPFQLFPIQLIFIISLALLLSYRKSQSIFSLQIWGKGIRLARIFLFFMGCSLIYLSSYKIYHYIEWGELKKKSLSKGNTSSKNLAFLYDKIHYLTHDDEFFAIDYAKALYRNHEYSKAIKVLENGITHGKSLPTHYYLLALCYYKYGKISEAEAVYLNLVYMMPGLITPKYSLARFYYNTGQISRFRKIAMDVLTLDPKLNNLESFKMKQEVKKLYILTSKPISER